MHALVLSKKIMAISINHMIFSVLNMPFSVFPSAARFCSGPIKIFHGGGGGGGGGSGGGGGGGGGGSGG